MKYDTLSNIRHSPKDTKVSRPSLAMLKYSCEHIKYESFSCEQKCWIKKKSDKIASISIICENPENHVRIHWEVTLLEGCVRFQGVCVKTGENASENRNERRKLYIICIYSNTRNRFLTNWEMLYCSSILIKFYYNSGKINYDSKLKPLKSTENPIFLLSNVLPLPLPMLLLNHHQHPNRHTL